MNKYIGLLLCLLLTGCGSIGVSALISNATALPSSSSLATRALGTPATPSIVPTATPTIGYQATAIVAQQTADESRRLNTQATAEYEQRIQEQFQFTAEAGAREFQKTQWTVTAAVQKAEWTTTAALTSIPLSATAQAVNSTSIAKYQALVAGQMTQTKEGPTMIVAMRYAEVNAQYAVVDVFVRDFSLMGVGIFLIGFGAFLFRAQRRPVPMNEPELRPMPKVNTYIEPMPSPSPSPISPAETVIRVKNTDPIYPAMDRMVIPCSPEKFTKLVTGVLNDGKTLAYENWERKPNENEKAPFVRDEFTKVRNFMQANKWVHGSGVRGTLELSPEGETIFIEWMNFQVLPKAYRFELSPKIYEFEQPKETEES